MPTSRSRRSILRRSARAGRAIALASVFAAAAGIAGACGGAGFQPATKIDTVRVLATRIDPPYVKPGQSATLTVLAVDGRKNRPRPMNVYWIPFPCVNPRNDLYYACFSGGGSGGSDGGAPDASGGDAGTGGVTGGASGGGKGGGIPIGDLLKPGVDLTPLLPSGPTFKVDVPADIVARHAPVPGIPEPYGLIVVFNIACAGHVEIDPSPPSGPQSVPLGCYDENHQRLGPDDYVIGFTRVYAYEDRTNANPVITTVVADGQPIDLQAGLTVAACTKDCVTNKLDVQVTPESAEPNPGDVDANGTERHEAVWADWYATDGALGGEARLLYDARSGKVTLPTTIDFHPPEAPAEGTIWVVVHDNRDGVDWRAFPLHAK